MTFTIIGTTTKDNLFGRYVNYYHYYNIPHLYVKDEKEIYVTKEADERFSFLWKNHIKKQSNEN